MQTHIPQFWKCSISTGAAILPSTNKSSIFGVTSSCHIICTSCGSTPPQKNIPKTAHDAINYMKEINKATVTTARPPNLQLSWQTNLDSHWPEFLCHFLCCTAVTRISPHLFSAQLLPAPSLQILMKKKTWRKNLQTSPSLPAKSTWKHLKTISKTLKSRKLFPYIITFQTFKYFHPNSSIWVLDPPQRLVFSIADSRVPNQRPGRSINGGTCGLHGILRYNVHRFIMCISTFFLNIILTL